MFEQVQDFSSEEATHHANWQEEIFASGDPSVVAFQAAAGDDGVDVRMVSHLLRPGMQDGQQADFPPEMFGVGRQGQESLGDGAKKDGITTPLVGSEELVEFIRDGKDDVEVWDGQQIGLSAVHPAFCGQELTGGTMSVPAGVEDVMLRAALITFVEMAPKSGRTAGLDSVHDAEMAPRHADLV